MSQRLIEFLLGATMATAIFVVDLTFDVGIARNLVVTPRWSAWVALAAIAVFLGGGWMVLTAADYRFQVGERVATANLGGVITHRSALRALPVYEVTLDDGQVIALAEDELVRGDLGRAT